VQFDAVNLTSGIYFYTLKTDSFSQTRKMLLLK
ncbi:T9SS type A sorting domain-containing protein, partial [bacterium BMS3Abin03]|nr:T9SS type A sorting domain-containing protein [bacterium BMS3Abin03]